MIAVIIIITSVIMAIVWCITVSSLCVLSAFLIVCIHKSCQILRVELLLTVS